MFTKKNLLSFLPLFLIILVATLARFIWLDKIPNAVGGDEIVYLVNAKASFITGHDIYGTWSPINGLFFKYPRGETQAELPYILDSFFVGPLPFSLFSARLANGIMGLFLVLFIFLVTKELFGKRPAITAGAVAAINPWLIFIGRTSYEAIPAMLFYFIAFYVLLKVKGWRILLAIPFLALAFYSYIATKLILIPFAFVILLYSYLVVNQKKYLKQYLIVFGFCIALIAFFVVSLKLNPSAARLNELISPNSPIIVSEVNDIRKTSIHTLLNNLFVNKYVLFGNIIFTKTLKTFSFDYLFVYGDEFFSIWRHGLFYYWDSLFLIIGSLFMFIKNRKLFFFFGSLILIGVIPQVMHTADVSNFSIHITMIIPFLIILIGFGISELVDIFKKKNIKILASILVILLYTFSFFNFFNIYVSWHPLQGFFDFPIRTLSLYAKRGEDSGQKVSIYSTASFDYFKKYLFYTNGYNKNTAALLTKHFDSNNLSLGNVSFLNCDSAVNFKNKNNLFIIDDRCVDMKTKSDHLTIPSLKDGGEIFMIFNDKVCSKAPLNTYVQNLTLNDFSMDKLTNDRFCTDYITHLSF